MNKEPTPEEIAAMLRVNPMRMLNRLTCEACGYQWQQPAPSGKCPTCHSSRTILRTEEFNAVCMVPRA